MRARWEGYPDDVAEILEQQQRNRQRMVRVMWEGYPDEKDWTRRRKLSR